MLKLFFKPLLILPTSFNLLISSFACFFYLTDSLSEIYSDISCTSLGVNFTFCMQFTGEATRVVVEHDWAILNNDWQTEIAFRA